MPSSLKSLLPSLSNAIGEHILKEKASFHTPGHKGFAWQVDGSFTIDNHLDEDLTELPGLDELADPQDVLATLENKAAAVWGAESTLLSINGATAGILAAITLVSRRGTHLLVPRNCHRSVVNAMVLSGLEPVWFDLCWEKDWGLWGAVDIQLLENTLRNFIASNSKSQIAAIIITGPTYAGARTNIQSLSKYLGVYKIPIIVDEAHGAHLPWTKNSNCAALVSGADIVIHSLHKTLSCPTQTGLVHISKKGAKEYSFNAIELRACLSLFQSSSPSYILMSAIDKLVSALIRGTAQEHLKNTELLGEKLQNIIQQNKNMILYETSTGNTATAILAKHDSLSAPDLYRFLIEKGIFPEAILGQGVLFLLGIGSQQKDIDLLQSALESLPQNHTLKKNYTDAPKQQKPKGIKQVLSPKEAFFMPSHLVPLAESVGQIAAECLAPCPPGWPVLVPGQQIEKEILSFTNIKFVRILETNS